MKSREYVDFKLAKCQWNTRVRKLLSKFHKYYRVFENTSSTLRIRIYDISMFYPIYCGSVNMVDVESADLMVLIATMNDINTLQVGNFAVEKSFDDKRYESGRVMFIRTKPDDDILRNYRPIHPLLCSIRRFYKQNEGLIKDAYDDIANDVLKIEIKNRGISEIKPVNVFLSVPISGLDIETVKSRVALIKNILYEIFGGQYLKVITPFEVCDNETDKPYSWFMGKDIEALLECDAIISLPGWESSKGCRCERATAEIYGLRIYDADDLIELFNSDILYQLLSNGDIRKFKVLDREFSGEMVSRVSSGKDIDTVHTDGSVDPLWDGYDNSFCLTEHDLFSKDYTHVRFFASEAKAVAAFHNKQTQPDLKYNVYMVALDDGMKVKRVFEGVSKEGGNLLDGENYFLHPVGVEQPDMDE